MDFGAAAGRDGEAGPRDGAAIVRAPIAGADKCGVGGNGIGDRDPRRPGIADVANGDRVVDVAAGSDRYTGVDLGDDEGGSRGRRVSQRPGAPAVRAGRQHPVVRVQIDLVDGHDRDAGTEGRPGGATVVGHKGTDVGRGIQGVRVGRINRERVDRVVGQVAADVGPRAACVSGLEHVARLVRRRSVIAVVRDVGDPVVAAVDGDPGHRPVGQRVLVAAAVAVLVEAGPRWVVARHRVGTEEDEPVVRAGVHARSAAHADR